MVTIHPHPYSWVVLRSMRGERIEARRVPGPMVEIRVCQGDQIADPAYLRLHRALVG
ncbi:hypothetical protein HNP84_009088 [Thermocatellispora tengchongensis]|uniref:Uncharacterized protein n=1 Tax=Thermocatellispora tengchongensis TaxID=1073253 RepID=A0A840PTT3_9ACTN|nr:hypothetical protein [Thermocatellispora tengchongensis]MBB5139325.1 hypothetical protein [Thermocatellispora tengchongensis]